MELRERLEALVTVAARLARAESVDDAARVATLEGVAAIGGRAGVFDTGARSASTCGTALRSSRLVEESEWLVLIVPVKTKDLRDGALSAEFPIAEERAARYLLASLADLLAAALERASLYAEARRANEAKDVFLATVSHELRGPLAAISMWTHVLGLKNCDEATRLRAGQAIEESVRSQGRLIEDMIDFSRLRTGKLRVKLARLSLPNVVGSAVDDAAEAASAKGVTLTFHPGGDLGVSGDVQRLRQVFAHVVSNAIEFTPAGGTIDVSVAQTPEGARVVVRDSGEGMSASFLPHVFEPFHQEDESLTRRRDGLGLGLAVACQLVELHGGSIRAESAGRGQGATFSIDLPLA